MRIIVPRPLQPTLVDTSHRLLPHSRRHKRLRRRGRVRRERQLGPRAELLLPLLVDGMMHLLDAARRDAPGGADVQGAGLSWHRGRGRLDLGRAEGGVPLAVGVVWLVSYSSSQEYLSIIFGGLRWMPLHLLKDARGVPGGRFGQRQRLRDTRRLRTANRSHRG